MINFLSSRTNTKSLVLFFILSLFSEFASTLLQLSKSASSADKKLVSDLTATEQLYQLPCMPYMVGCGSYTTSIENLLLFTSSLISSSHNFNFFQELNLQVKQMLVQLGTFCFLFSRKSYKIMDLAWK